MLVLGEAQDSGPWHQVLDPRRMKELAGNSLLVSAYQVEAASWGQGLDIWGEISLKGYLGTRGNILCGFPY